MQIWYHIVQCDLQSHGRYEIFISSNDKVEKNTFSIDSTNPISRRIENINFREQNSSGINGYGSDRSTMI